MRKRLLEAMRSDAGRALVLVVILLISIVNLLLKVFGIGR